MGTMTFGGTGGFASVGSTGVEEAGRQVDQCLDAGINLIDTANVYSGGLSEEILGKVLEGRRDQVLVATKARMPMGEGPNDAGLSRHHLIRECEASLRRLGTDRIDLYQVHEWDGQTPLEETLAALDDLVRAGKVRYVGCSNYAGWQLMKALGIAERRGLSRFVSQQIHYTLQAREAEYELVPIAVDQGLGLLVWSPLAGGLLVEYASWRWVFFINLPVGILLAAAAPSLIAAVRPAHRARRLDLLGALAGTLATAAIIYGLVSAGSDGWGATTTLLWLAAGLVLAGGFVAVERTAREPLVPLGLLARRPLLVGQLVMLASSGLLLATYFLASLYLQRLLGYSALDTGLVFLPAALATIVGSHLAAQAVGHLGPRPVAVVGFTLAAAGTLVLSRLPADASILVDLLPDLLLATAGLGAGFVVATTTAMAHVDQAQAGVTSGLLSTGHELGASLALNPVGPSRSRST